MSDLNLEESTSEIVECDCTAAELPRAERAHEKGQGLVEYAMVLVLVAVVAMVSLSAIAPMITGRFFDIQCSLKEGIVTDEPDFRYCNHRTTDALLGQHDKNTHEITWFD